MPRPHAEDQQHNRTVGRALRLYAADLDREGVPLPEVDRAVGISINTVAQAAYDLGAREAVIPSVN